MKIQLDEANQNVCVLKKELEGKTAVIDAMTAHHDALMADIECRAHKRETVCRSRCAPLLPMLQGLVAE